MTAKARPLFSPSECRHPSIMSPLKITVAPNGARLGHENHPQLPVTTLEIAREARLCQKAGADEIHLHVRDDEGGHSLDPGRYREAMEAIHERAPGLSIQVSTEAAGLFDVATQFETLRALCPAAASISIREVMRSPEQAAEVYGFAGEAGIAVQHILYDSQDLRLLRAHLADGTIPGQMRDVLLVMGRYDPPCFARVDNVAGMVAALDEEFPNWTVCAFGPTEHAVACAAMEAGGHVRIGFENNLFRPDGRLAVDNAENIARAVQAARNLGRPMLKEVAQT